MFVAFSGFQIGFDPQGARKRLGTLLLLELINL